MFVYDERAEQHERDLQGHWQSKRDAKYCHGSRSDDTAEADVASDDRDDEKTGEANESDGGNRAEQHAKSGCDAFAALKAEPRRQRVSNYRGTSDEKRPLNVVKRGVHQQRGNQPFCHVNDENERPSFGATRAPHVRRANVAATYRPDINSVRSRNQHTDRNRSKQESTNGVEY